MSAAPLPVLTVSRTGLRRVAIAVFDRLGYLRRHRVLDLRCRTDSTSRLDAIRSAITKLIREQNVACVIVEAPSKRSRPPAGFEDMLLDIADTERIWLREQSLIVALRTIAPAASSTSVMRKLANQYPPLSARLLPTRPSLFRDRDHERDVRPLANAVILGHAQVLEVHRFTPKATALNPIAT